MSNENKDTVTKEQKAFTVTIRANTEEYIDDFVEMNQGDTLSEDCNGFIVSLRMDHGKTMVVAQGHLPPSSIVAIFDALENNDRNVTEYFAKWHMQAHPEDFEFNSVLALQSMKHGIKLMRKESEDNDATSGD